MSVLVVDDNPTNVALLRGLLQDAGMHRVYTQTDSRQVADQLTVVDPDLILLDLHMPEMGGFDVLKKITEGNMKTKVCILTNFSFPQYKTKSLALGADYFLNKSDDFEKINDVIANLLKEA